MAYNRGNDSTKENTNDKHQPLFRDAVYRYENRHQELDDRERLLHDKITIMERSVPTLMAMSMWQGSDGKLDSVGALDKVRNIMKKLSPLPDPADELVAQITDQVEKLNRETAELHDKIINVDVELEENCMELESLELANCELQEQIKCMETKMDVSLESISSDDRICLSKIRKLGEEEKRIKKNIKELESRETSLRGQIEKILGSKGTDSKKICHTLQGNKHHVHRSRSRRKKDCQRFESTIESLYERNETCGKTHCGALNKLMEQKNPLLCKCQRKLKSSYRKTNSCERTMHKCCQKKCLEKSSEHRDLETKSSRKYPESSENPWCTPDLVEQHSCSSLPYKQTSEDCTRGNTKPCDKSNTPCAMILIKTCGCKNQSEKPSDKTKSSRNLQNRVLESPYFTETLENPRCTAGDCSSLVVPEHVESIEIRTEQLVLYDETHIVTNQNSRVD